MNTRSILQELLQSGGSFNVREICKLGALMLDSPDNILD